MTLAILLAAALSSQIATPASTDCGVKYRGIFVNDEDWGLRPWAVKHFGKKNSAIVCGELAALVGYIPGVSIKMDTKTKRINLEVAK